MRLQEILTEATIQVESGEVDKWTVIDRLVDSLATSNAEVDGSAVHTAVLDREHQGSTGLEHGIAVPHARCEGLPGVMAALAISRDGIDFESADGQPCHLVFLIVAPPGESANYLQLLSEVATIGENPERISRLRQAAAAQDALAILGESPQELV